MQCAIRRQLVRKPVDLAKKIIVAFGQGRGTLGVKRQPISVDPLC